MTTATADWPVNIMTKTGDKMTIRDIVRRGQELLASPRMSPAITAPGTSLGELCIELAQDRLAYDVTHPRWFHDGQGGFDYGFKTRDIRGDTQRLRTLMYHKNRLTPYEQIESAWWGTLRSMAEAHDREICAIFAVDL